MATDTATLPIAPADDSAAVSSGSTAAAAAGAQSDLLQRVVQGAHETIDRLAETAAPHVHRLQESIGSTGEMLHARADQVRATGEEWTESLRTTVRENPLAAVVTALALGMLIARLTRR